MVSSMTRRSTLLALAGSIVMITTGGTQQAPSPAASAAILINNVRIFDGVGEQLRPGNLLVRGRKIERISSDPIAAPAGSTVFDGGGRVLMPGLTDAHWHVMMAPNTLDNRERAVPGLMYANAVAEAEWTLLRGFTSVRDVAGPTFGIKAAIDTGVIPGPRVYPSGAFRLQRAKISDALEPSGTPLPSFGLSAAPIPPLTRRSRKRAASTIPVWDRRPR